MVELPDEIRSAIYTIYEAGYDRSVWEQGLGKLCGAMGAASSMLMPRSAADNTLHLPFSPDLQDCFERYVAEGWYTKDLRALRGWVLADRGQRVLLEQDMMSEEDHQKQPFYQELIIPTAWRWSSSVTFTTQNESYVFSLFNSDRRGAFAEADRSLIEAFWPHLARAVSMSERFGRFQNSLGLDVLETAGEAAMLVDWRGRVVGLTRAAEDLLGDGITVREGKLRGTRQSGAREIDALIDRALADGPTATPPIWIARPGKRALMMDVLPVPEPQSGCFLLARLIVLLTDPDKAARPAHEVVRDGFRLTPAEMRLAFDLFAGLSMAESAEQHAISRETAKTHLKSIFYKTGTNRQSELVRLLQSIARRMPGQDAS
jgi:DNA-binding CsgD family transcriptional regulator